MEKIKQNPFVKKVGFNRILLILVLIAMYIIFCAIIPGFFGAAHLLSISNYACFLGFLALGVTFVIATGGIDFSIGPVMFCCALISGYTYNMYGAPMFVALLLCIAVGLLFGCFNGYMVAYWNVPPFIISMASMNIAKGLASVYTSTQTVSWPQATDADGWFRSLLKVGNVPIGLILFIVIAAICAIILNNTRPGRYILSLGSNREAVRLSGVNTKKWEMIAFIICGTLAGIAGIFFAAAYTTVQPGYGDQYNNEAIASCVMGGTSMIGGLASISGTVIGTLIISLIQEGVLALGFAKDIQLIITAVIVIVAVYIDVSSRRRRT